RAIREQINSAVNVIMHLDRMPDGRRIVTSVTEVQGLEGDTILLQEVFRHRTVAEEDRSGNELVATGLRPKFLDKLHSLGIDVPAKVFQRPTVRVGVPEGRGRSARVPSARELAEPERSR
ncbi:MAG: hypothetical protein H0W70_13715, partial [Actinobacteria bacterium]|nr:hypothetical protein [Actinomycetota bacterium]